MTNSTIPFWKRRWFLIGTGTLLLLAVLVAVALPMLLDVERYRPHIEQALRDATGWEPDLGSIDVSLFPQPAVHVGSSRLSSPATESSVAIGSLDVAASFWPLLKGTLSIEDITLDAPVVTLIRQAEDVDWDIPVPPSANTATGAPEAGASGADKPADERDVSQPAADPEAGGPGLDVEVRRIRVRNGSVHIEDRSVAPPRILAIEPFTMTVLPEDGRFDGSARLAPDGGSMHWEGTFADGLTLTLEDLATGRLAAIVGSDLLQPGGTLSGTVNVGLPFAVTGTVQGRELALATGAQPIGEADLAFRVVGDPAGLQLESTRLSVGSLHIDGSGRLTPALDLKLVIPEAPLEGVLEAMRGVAQFPLDVEGPGTASAEIVVFQDEDATIRYSAGGQLSARRLNAAEFLPPVEDLQATFDLSEQDRLIVHVTSGRVAGGPMRGKIVLHPVDPPGVLRFDGTLRKASMGGLLAGFVEGAAEKILGPTSVQAAVTLDLGRDVVDANAVGGTVKLSSGKITLPGWDVEGKIERELADRLSRLNLTSLLEKNTSAELGTSDVPVAFDAMKAELKLDAIPWSLDGLQLNRDGGALTGAGSFNPLDGTVAIDVNVELSLKRSAKLVEEHRSLKVLLDSDGHIRLPLGLSGAIDQPAVKVDLGDIADEVLNSDDVKKDLVDKLKGLFDDDDD